MIILFAIIGTAVREQFVDHMMRNLTSETVFLLTTFVNMATSCDSDSDEEIEFINTVALELFEVCHNMHNVFLVLQILFITLLKYLM